MLNVLRLSFVLLALSALTGLAGIEPGTRPHAPAYSANAKVLAKLRAVHPSPSLPARLGSTHARLITAELEDGPEGEEGPVANFVRSFDGDDQFAMRGSSAALAFDRNGVVLLSRWTVPGSSHSPRAGFATAPPAA